MKKIAPKVFLLLSFCTCIFSGCTDYAKINKELLGGYAVYQECLKSCDALEAKYTAEYEACYKNCPVILHTEHCFHLSTEEKKEQCLAEEFAKQEPCLSCANEYANHLKEVEACRKECLTAYNNLQSIYIP